MMFGIDRVAASAVDYALEYVTDLVFNDDGTVDGKGANDRTVSTKAGYHFGFYSRPKDKAVGIIVRFLGLSFLAAFRDKQFEMSLQKGEVGIKNAFGANVLLDKNGVVNINGTDYALIKDTLLDDLGNLLKCIGAVVISNSSAPGAPLAGAVLAAADIGADPAALATNLLEIPRLVTKLNVVANYKSTKGKFG